ncbi:MAG TPA: PKD domain-containing protein, partial [Bacteroidetes bacterium]|nr:PKD domain-containing protein [Bacteroidota bacterium]
AACAEANNNKSIAGVGYHTRYLPLKASVNQSLGISYGMDAITYAADHNVDIINLSWGSGAFSSFGQNVVDYAAINKQCLLVAAAGNHHNNTFVYPASYKHVISTAAVQTADGAWKQNNGTGTTYNYLIDVSAPGRNIMTTTGGGGVWVGATGTSMAAPLMCAVAALVKAKYPNLNSIQAGEVVRTTAKNIYSQNPTLLERLGKGRIDALQALTQSGVKSVRLDTLLVQDGINDIPEPFDTLNITGKFINYLDPTQNLEIDISSPNVELVQVIQGSSTIGTMATGSFASTPTPLRIFIKKAVTTPTKIWLRFGISDGNYTDYQYHELIIYPNRIDLDANQVKTTINGSGNFGFVDYPGFQYGLGFQYNNNYNVIRDAGFLIGISASNVVDMVRNDFGERDTDFEPVMKPYATSPGTHADLEAHARFQDINGGTQTIGVDVSHNAYQYSGGGQTQYTIFEYVIRNTNNYPINDAYAGLYSQWSRSFYNCSDGKFLPASNAVVAKFTTASNDFYTGITLLTQHSINAYVTTESQFNFSSQAKFDALHYQPGSQSPVNGDVVEFISAGPFNLAAGDSAVVAFALLAAPDLPTFDVVATNAKQQYNCVIKNLVPSTDLGTDVILCEAVGLPTFDAGAAPGNSYLWSTGATTQTISPQAEGSYSVTVSNSYGCTAIDTVALFVRPLNNFAITSSNAGFYTGRTSNFEVDDPGNVLTSFAWDFGDGNTSAQASPAHVFTQPGQYTVTVVIDNGYCTKTLSYTLTVSIATSVQSAAGQAVKFFPNPVQDRLQFRMEYDYTGNVIIEIFDNSGKRVQQK